MHATDMTHILVIYQSNASFVIHSILSLRVKASLKHVAIAIIGKIALIAIWH